MIAINYVFMIKYLPYIIFCFNNIHIILAIIGFIYNNIKYSSKKSDENITEWIIVEIKE
jgi:hypothetical protein